MVIRLFLIINYFVRITMPVRWLQSKYEGSEKIVGKELIDIKKM